MKGCHHLTLETRLKLETLLDIGQRPTAIARYLGLHRGTLWRERRRNAAPQPPLYDARLRRAWPAPAAAPARSGLSFQAARNPGRPQRFALCVAQWPDSLHRRSSLLIGRKPSTTGRLLSTLKQYQISFG